MANKKKYNCQYCGAEVLGYRSKNDHENRCPFNPKNAIEPPVESTIDSEATASDVQETAETDNPAVTAESETPFIEHEEPPLENNIDLPENIGNLIDARIGFRLAQLEERLDNRDKEYGEQFTAALNNMPQIIDQAVVKYISGAGGASPAGPPAVTGDAPPTSTNQPPARTGILNIMGTQVDFGNLAVEWIKSKGSGNFEKGLINLLTGKASQKTRATDAKYSTRGMNNMSAMLRMKGADPVAMAIAHKSQAEQMLKENIPAQMRDYYIGQKSQADAFLAGVELQKSYQSAAENVTIQTPDGEPGQA